MSATLLKTETPSIHITMIGPVPFATPTAKPALTPRQTAWIERAWIAASEGRTGAVEHCVRMAERRIWPMGFDPHAALERCSTAPAERASAARAEQRARENAAVDRAIALTARDASLSEHDERAVLIADNERFPARDRRARMVKIESRHKAKVESEALTRRLRETKDLAEARGEEVEQAPSGAIRAIDRDPILALIRQQKLSPDQFDTALKCREMYERQAADVGAVEYGDTGRTDHDNSRFVWTRLQRAKVTAIISRVEVEIAFRCRGERGPGRTALKTFQQVVGQRVSLRSIAGGRLYEALIDDLRMALDVAADVLP